MKKIILHAVLAAVLVGCSEEVPLPSAPSNPGSDITFAIRLTDNAQSRTLYGDEANNAFPIYWVNNDQIIVASPQCAAGRNNSVYQVTVSGDTQNSAEAVTKVGDTGVQWGDKLPANFYSIYPVTYNATATDVIENSIVNGADDAVAHLYVRKYQRNLFTKIGNTWKGTPIDRKSISDLDANQKYPDALMYAQTKQTTDGDVMLTFKPFTVAFNVTLQGYELAEGLGNDPTVTIEEVIITAPVGTKLVGNFDAKFDAECVAAPTVDTSVNPLQEPHIIHVLTFQSLDGKYLTINKDESVNFNVFAIPIDRTTVNDTWTLTVRTSAGTYRRSLNPGKGDGAGNLIAGQVHKLNMPKFEVKNTFNFDNQRWIAQIPRNIYVSELSIPGAWYGTKSEYQGSVTFESLWNAGVRAFAIETRSAGMSAWSSPGTPAQVVVSGTGSNQTFGSGYYGGTPIRTVMRDIIAVLKDHTDEYAVLVLSYADGGKGGHRAEDYAFWLEGIYKEFDALSVDDKNDYVYQQEITPNTTVDDVLGKLIIKVNAASGLPGGEIKFGNYGNNIPGLLSHTSLAWDETNSNSSLISQMYWSNWSDDYMVNIDRDVTALNPNSLYWNYTVANRTKTDENNEQGLPSYANRKSSISNILANSRAIYEAGSHNVWFYVGAGGNEATSTTSETTDATAQTFAGVMNSWINDQLKDKIEGGDFSPFGIVMCNYITDNDFSGPAIVENIIKMNRLFRLTRNEDEPSWPDAGGGGGTTPANSPEDYSASNIDGGNAWSIEQQ